MLVIRGNPRRTSEALRPLPKRGIDQYFDGYLATTHRSSIHNGEIAPIHRLSNGDSQVFWYCGFKRLAKNIPLKRRRSRQLSPFLINLIADVANCSLLFRESQKIKW